MTKRVEYIIRISADDRYRHRHITEMGKVQYFSLQIETKIENNWYPVVRYDTAHGFAHRDILNKKGEIMDKTPLFNQDYNSALTFAESDLKVNWSYYKQKFLNPDYYE